MRISNSSSYLARRPMMKNRYGKMGGVGHPDPAWSMSSVMTALPEIAEESPTTICNPGHNANKYCHRRGTSEEDNATHFATPRNKRFGIRCNDSLNDDDDNCFSDIDEWLEHANKFCSSCNHHTTDYHHHRTEQEDLRISAVVCNDDNNFLTAASSSEHEELCNIILPSVREESLPLHLTTSKSSERTRLMSRRPRARPPYFDDFFLNNNNKNNNHVVTRKKLQAAAAAAAVDRDARNKAKHVQLMHRLRRKEGAINDWELQQTRKAMDHMNKIQNELERKQVMASARTQKKIRSVREKAEKQKLNLRRSTMKKYQQLQTSSETTTHSPSCSPWDSRSLPFC